MRAAVELENVNETDDSAVRTLGHHDHASVSEPFGSRRRRVPLVWLEKVHQECVGLILDPLEMREVGRDGRADLHGHPFIV
ncbi:hypothetical protein GCM10027058_24670 [Microbacterium neimengense]